MINPLRAAIRLLLFFIVSLLTVIFVAIGNIILRLFSNRLAVSWKNKVVKSWAWLVGWIIGAKVKVHGKKPENPFLLVSNHLSYLDPMIFWRYLDATFVAKSEIKSWPFFGWGAKTLGILFINRELRRDVHRMNERISESITENQGVVLFPEGTSTKGAEVLPFNAPLLQYPIDTQMPVHFATITYDAPSPWKPHLDLCWWGDMPFFSHFWKLLKMPGFTITITFGEKAILASDRKVLADKLHKAVTHQFTPVIKETAYNFQHN